jgi:chromosome partitioning protein
LNLEREPLNNERLNGNGLDCMERVTTVANQKGGVGKTTCAMNLGYGLAQLGRRILLVDLDPQANLTACCGVSTDSVENTLYDVFRNTCPFTDTIIEIEEHFYLAPSHLRLTSIERELFGRIGYERILKKALSPLVGDFDHVIIDCPPSLGSLTINGLVACNEVFITVACEHLSLIGVSKLLDTIVAIRENYNPEIRVGKVIPVMYSKTILANEMLKQLWNHFNHTLSSTKIRRNVKIGESTAVGKSILAYDPGSIGARDFTDLIRELI